MGILYNQRSEEQKHKIRILLGAGAVIMVFLAVVMLFIQYQENHKIIVTGHITTISEIGEHTVFLEPMNNYDRYEIEKNAGTFIYGTTLYQTHRVTLWSGDNKAVFNNVINYELKQVYSQKATRDV